MEMTLIYAVMLAAITLARPLVGLFVLILLPQPGVSGILRETFGLKPWAGQLAVGLLGCLALLKMLKNRNSDRFWPIMILVSSAFYIIATNVLLKGGIVQASFNMVLHGGLLAAFFIYSSTNHRFWNVVLAGMLTLLILSAATYWLSDLIPGISGFNGLLYGSEEEVLRRAENINDLIERTARGTGVFANANCWAQMSSFGVVIGLAMALLTKSRSRRYGLILFGVSVFGILGSMGRSATFAAILGTVCLLGARYLNRSALTRLSVLILTVVIGCGVLFWAQERALHDTAFKIGDSEKMDWRVEQVKGVTERIEEYWLAGGQDPDPKNMKDQPHDLVMAYVFNFGIIPALVLVLAIVGGLFATARWIKVGGERLGYEIGLPANVSWAGHIVVPVFLVVMLNGIGNGMAGGTPYRELFLMYLYVWVRIRRHAAQRSLPLQRASASTATAECT